MTSFSKSKLKLVNYSKIIDITDDNISDYILNNTLDKKVINQLFNNTIVCFPENPDKNELHYYLRLINFVHNDLNHISSPKSSPNAVIIQDNLYEQIFEVIDDDHPEKWELFILYKNDKLKEVVASCFVIYNLRSGTAKFKEICVNSKYSGKGICSILIADVFKHIKDDIEQNNSNIKKISIYCEKRNVAACKCYSKIFDNKLDYFTHKDDLENGIPVTRFIFTIPKQPKRKRKESKT